MSMAHAVLVDHPVHFPGQCLCGSQKGPVVDTMMEKAGLHIYICKLCGQQLSRLFGFADGAELDRLMDARGELDRAEQSMARQAENVKGLTAKIVELKGELAEARADRDFAVGEAENLKHIARAIEASTSELVGASGPSEAA